MGNEEQGIFQAQSRAAGEQLAGKDGLRELQRRGVFYLDERIFVYLLALAFIGLLVVWAVASSALVLFGSLAMVIVMTLLWGIARMRGIENRRRQRELEARAFEAERKLQVKDH